MNEPASLIQNRILSRLKNAKRLRYSELAIGSVPNDLFNYHLQQLVKKEYVLREADGYSLSAKGEKYIADPYPAGEPLTSLYKMNVITIVSRRGADGIEILNQDRTSNPSYGKIGVPGGIVRKGEPIEAAARRKLAEETGLEADFRLVGCERRMMYKNGELFSDVLFPIAYSGKSSGALLHETDYGRNFWVPIADAIKNESAAFDTIKAIPKVLRALKAGRLPRLPFFFEESIQSDQIS